MSRSLPRALLAFLFLSALSSPVPSQEECTIGVASGGATADGRPLLWKNRDTSADSRNIVELRKGKRFSFLGLVNPGSRNVWAGVNEAGFALVNAQSADLGEAGQRGPGNGTFLAAALGECSGLKDFRGLLERTNRTGRSTHTSYGAIDARGGAGIFEVKGRSFVFFDACDPKTAPQGWIVRTNFAFTGDGKRGGGTARYLRARFLWGKLRRLGELDARRVLRICARDLASPGGKPYSLPFAQPDDRLPPFGIETFSTIDRYTTRAAVVFAGVRKGRDPRGTVMWGIMGEPLFSVAVPFWVAGGDPPAAVRGRRSSPILDVERRMKKLLYVELFRFGKPRFYLDTRPLPGILAKLYNTEDRIFDATAAFERAGGPSRAGAVRAFQVRAAKRALSAMKEVLAFWEEAAPVRVGVFSGTGVGRLEAETALAALRSDPGLSAFPVDARDLVSGSLDFMDVILFPGGEESLEGCDLGGLGRRKVKDFVLRGGGFVGISGGAVLGAGSSPGPWSLSLASVRAVGSGRKGLVEVEVTGGGEEVFPELAGAGRLFCRCAGGPLFVPEKVKDLEPCRVLLRLGSKAPGGAFLVSGRAGKGRVFLCAGRPDATRGLKWMVPRLARLAAGRPPVSYPAAVRSIPPGRKEILLDGGLAGRWNAFLRKIGCGGGGKAVAGLEEWLDYPAEGPDLLALGLLRSLDPQVRARAARFLGKREFLPASPALEAALAGEKDEACRSALEKALKALSPFRPVPGLFPERWYERKVRILGSLVPGRTRLVEGPGEGLYHHFFLPVPPGTERLVVNVHEISGNRDLSLYARPGGPAFPGAPGTVEAGGKLSPRRTLVVDVPRPGRWFVAVRADFPASTTTEEWGRKRYTLPPAFRGVKYAITVYTPALAYRPAGKEGFYKDLFMDSGVALTSRRNLPAADMLGLTLEYLALPNRGATEADRALQVKLLAGWKDDANGILLYPDGAPRFRCVYVNGGSATRHGASLGPRGREAFRRFFRGGGSYTGSCAGAYLPTLAPRRQKLRKEYLHIWPGHVQPTGLLKTPTGLFLPPGSPLLRFYDYGGDRYVASVYHNGGCFADDGNPWFWAPGTEVLARYDYPGRGMHRKVASWAWKPSPLAGRLAVIGSHPEGIGWGEQRDLMAAILRYALDGTGRPRVKARLSNGVPLRMEDRSSPGREPIGDRQYHHFTIQVPPGTRLLEVRVRSLRPGRNLDLFLRKGDFAFLGAKGVKASTGPSPEEVIRLASPPPGMWFVGVKEVTTVEYERVEWGWKYTGRLDVLNGVPYEIEGRWK